MSRWAMRPTIWNIRVMIETNDDSVVQATTDAIRKTLCGPEHLLGPEHRCDPPWFIVTSPLNKKKAKGWRQLLNR